MKSASDAFEVSIRVHTVRRQMEGMCRKDKIELCPLASESFNLDLETIKLL